MKYYFVDAITLYDGMEFETRFAIKSNREKTRKQIEDIAEEMAIHQDSGEELYRVDFKEITKKEYEIFEKLIKYEYQNS